jgi:hypothetical protein
MKKILLSIALLGLNLNAINIDKSITISGDNGGYVKDGSAWNFSENKNKVRILMYVDPDEQSKGEAFMPTTFDLEKKYGQKDFVIQVILNLDATWIPNMVINKKLELKQIKIPNREFIIDKESVLVKKWGLIDNEYNVLAFDSNNNLIFNKVGEMSKKDITELSNKLDEAIKTQK